MKIRRSQRNDTIVHVNASIQIAFFCLKGTLQFGQQFINVHT